MSRTCPSSHVLLEVIAGPHAGHRLEYDRHDTLLVGRGSAAQLRLVNDPHFSRNHFLLEVNPPDVLLRDLGSRNGTFVNGKKVCQCRLRPGDVISGGQTQVRFTLLDVADAVGTIDLPATPAQPRTTVHTPVALTADAPSAPAMTRSEISPQSAWTAEPTSARPSAPRPRVPGYDIDRPLGQGGMGAVYLARHQASGAQVAVKVIVPESAASDRAVNLFFREARVLSQLRHPHIVRFHEMGLHLGQVYLVMEYVETIDPKVLFAGLTPADRARVACAAVCQVLEGLHHAHQMGFVHRDVKPGNILLARGEGGEPVRAMLADFGLAKNYENAGLSGMTHEGEALGTVPFMCPEQVVSSREARPAVDVYGAAAALYALISGAYPHDFPRGRDPLLIVLEEPAVPLHRRCPDVPAGLADVIDRGLAKKPGDRFPTAEAFRQSLRPYAGG